MVVLVGLEPTRLATIDFESTASAEFRHSTIWEEMYLLHIADEA